MMNSPRRSSVFSSSFFAAALAAGAFLAGCSIQADLGDALGSLHAGKKGDPTADDAGSGLSSSGSSNPGSDAGVPDDCGYGWRCSYPNTSADAGVGPGSSEGSDAGVPSSSGWGGDAGVGSSSGWGGDSDAGFSSSSGVE
jgi:hypothetical protein